MALYSRPARECKRMVQYDRYQALADAIVLQAVRDYREAMAEIQKEKYDYSMLEAQRTVDEVKRFFKSDWFGVLTDVDPDLLLEQLNQEFDENAG